ncbi:MAG: DUF4115 domain-containing protein [Chloroflexi bacterium]|nr:DUF4115 domain-containing protein [Chloroflexota bacterium]
MPDSIGEILKNQRLDRKLSLDDAAGSTHIRYKYLEALENNDFDLLPSAVQGRGFLRSYAEFLDLDPEPLLNGWEQKVIVSKITDQQDIDTHFPDKSIPAPIIDTNEPAEPDALPKTQDNADTTPSPIYEPQSVSPPSILPSSVQQVEAHKSATRFMEVGNTLRSQREILGLSLSDIEQYTHIRQFYLQAIEDGRFQELPSPVQAKGMIENYAQFLDINSDELLLDYAEGLQAQREEKLALNNPPTRGNKPARKPGKQTLAKKLLTPDLLIGSIVIIFLVVFAIWTTSRVIANRNLEAEATIPGISDVLVSTTSPSPDVMSATASLSASSLETPSPEMNTTPAIAAEIQTNAVPSSGSAEITSAVAFEDNAPLQIYIVTKQRTYLKVIVDEKTVFEGRSQPGNAYPFSGTESIELISGNAAALQIIFNEADLGTIGAFGEVVDLIFTGGRVVTPTPRFTATATSTTPPTMTLQPTATPVTPTVTPYIP